MAGEGGRREEEGSGSKDGGGAAREEQGGRRGDKEGGLTGLEEEERGCGLFLRTGIREGDTEGRRGDRTTRSLGRCGWCSLPRSFLSALAAASSCFPSAVFSTAMCSFCFSVSLCLRSSFSISSFTSSPRASIRERERDLAFRPPFLSLSLPSVLMTTTAVFAPAESGAGGGAGRFCGEGGVEAAEEGTRDGGERAREGCSGSDFALGVGVGSGQEGGEAAIAAAAAWEGESGSREEEEEEGGGAAMPAGGACAGAGEGDRERPLRLTARITAGCTDAISGPVLCCCDATLLLPLALSAPTSPTTVSSTSIATGAASASF